MYGLRTGRVKPGRGEETERSNGFPLHHFFCKTDMSVGVTRASPAPAQKAPRNLPLLAMDSVSCLSLTV